MKLRYIFLAIILASCKGDDNEFKFYELVPGEYTGYMKFYPGNKTGGMVLHDPAQSVDDGYRVTISASGENYVLSFDETADKTIPDITVTMTPVDEPTYVVIDATAGQQYSTTGPFGSPTDMPFSSFEISESDRMLHCYLNLKSSDPDDVHYFQIGVSRTY